MKDELNKIIKKERQRYFNFFAQEIQTLISSNEISASELPLQVNDKSLIEPFNIIRVDFISKNDKDESNISELRLDQNLTYDKFETTFGNLKIEIQPFCWNSCKISSDKMEITYLKEWTTNWLKIDQEIDTNLSGAIHSCSIPTIVDNRFVFLVDFGTASEDAFADLLQTLSDMGTTELLVQTIEV